MKDCNCDHMCLELRYAIALLSVYVLVDALRPWWLVFHESGTILQRVASFLPFSPLITGLAFVAFGILLVPLILCNLLGCPERKYTKLGISGACLIAGSWFTLAYVARHVAQAERWIVFEFMQTGAMALFFGMLQAIALNNEAKRKYQQRYG